MKKKDTVLEKKFNKGDVIVTTTWRDGAPGSVNKHMLATNIYDHDISLDEAAELHLDYMRKTFGMCQDWTVEQMKELMAEDSTKYFINTRGEVQSYSNHEVADEFDKLYFNNDIDKSIISKLRYKYIQEFNVQLSKYEGDEHMYFRVFDDITEWINKELKSNNI